MIDITKKIIEALQQLDCNDLEECRNTLVKLRADCNDFMCCSASLEEIPAEQFDAFLAELNEAEEIAIDTTRELLQIGDCCNECYRQNNDNEFLPR